jgi:hypothetical protein
VTRRERLVGFKYTPRGTAVVAEVRKSCRDELKILYSGAVFDDAVWKRLATLGEVNVLEASKLNPAMKDLVRIKGDGVRVEGARNGELVVAFFAPGRRGLWRKRIERMLAPLAP